MWVNLGQVKAQRTCKSVGGYRFVEAPGRSMIRHATVYSIVGSVTWAKTVQIRHSPYGRYASGGEQSVKPCPVHRTFVGLISGGQAGIAKGSIRRLCELIIS